MKNQYQRELIKRKQHQYSTDEDSDTDTDTDTESNDSHKLVIDIQNITNSISDSVSNIKETLTQIKPDLETQTKILVCSQTTNNKSIPCTIFL